MAGHGGPDLVQDGLVLSLDAASKNSYPGSGTTWTDLSGNGNNGTLSAAAIGTDVPGSMDFNGSDEYITTGYNLGSSVTQLTLGAWIKVDTYTNDGDCIALGDSSDGTGQCYLGVGTSGGNTMDWRFYTGDYLDETQYLTSSTDWIYYVAAYEQDTGQGRQKLYANGILKDTALSNNTSGIDFSGGKNVRIGTSTGDHAFFDGKINVVQIYNRSLSAKEVSQNFNAHRSRFGA